MPGYAHQNTDAALDAASLAHSALLVIDELGEVDASPFADKIRTPTQNSARLCRAARAAGVPVIFANDAHIPGLDRELELWGPHNLAGAPESQPSSVLECQEGDFVVEKRRYSAFFQTPLRLLLDELGVDTLILCGFDTNICVMHTAADAYYNNYRLIVVGDATETFLIGDQASGLEYMQKCYAAKLVDTDKAVTLLADVKAVRP